MGGIGGLVTLMREWVFPVGTIVDCRRLLLMHDA